MLTKRSNVYSVTHYLVEYLAASSANGERRSSSLIVIIGVDLLSLFVALYVTSSQSAA